MRGHWQKEIPTKDGQYWTANRNGEIAGLKIVAYLDGKLVYAGFRVRDHVPPEWDAWGGWWWSEPVEEPPQPGPWTRET